MRIYHQCGHNFVWNVDSISEDGSGDGLILSPVNLRADLIRDKVPAGMLAESWLDPQFYVPFDSKNKLASYPFFPANALDVGSTAELSRNADSIAKACLEFQVDLGLKYLVAPTRHYAAAPEDYLTQLSQQIVTPFVSEYEKLSVDTDLLLTVVVRPSQLEMGQLRDRVLSWATSHDSVSGIYLIFEHDSQSKQLKDPEALAGALRFIFSLREAGLEVHVGYSGLEGLLYSAADPTSVSVGSYENLRSFSTRRFETSEPSPRHGPRPRVFSGRLLQWIEDAALPPLRQLLPSWEDYFDESPYKEFLLADDSRLSFQRGEIYKHYFSVFANYVADLPAVAQRGEHLSDLARSALSRFTEIQDANVFLNSDSDGSHLPAWINALAMFKDQPE